MSCSVLNVFSEKLLCGFIDGEGLRGDNWRGVFLKESLRPLWAAGSEQRGIQASNGGPAGRNTTPGNTLQQTPAAFGHGGVDTLFN